MSAWKAAGITYVPLIDLIHLDWHTDVVYSYLQYASICARAVRNSLKDEVRAPALRREANNLKFAKWENGVQKEQVSHFLLLASGLYWLYIFE